MLLSLTTLFTRVSGSMFSSAFRLKRRPLLTSELFFFRPRKIPNPEYYEDKTPLANVANIVCSFQRLFSNSICAIADLGPAILRLVLALNSGQVSECHLYIVNLF